MRSLLIGLLTFCLLGLQSANAQKSKHVVLISIDGFLPKFYMDPSWGMVNLRIEMKKGIYAKGVNSVFPSLTLPSHTSMITGVPPAEHGIYYNAPFRPRRSSSEWFWYFKDIQAPTLWEAVDSAGMNTAAVNWPVTVGAPIDYNVPVIKKSGMTQLAATIPYCTPKGLMKEIQKEATGEIDPIAFTKKGDYIVQDQTMARIGAYLIRKYKPALTTIHLSVVDHFEHKEGRDGPMVRRSVSGADRAVRTIVESIKRAGISKNTTVIVTGDHGHVDKFTLISPNVWLKKAGLITDIKKGEWKAQFNTAGGSAFLMLKDPNDEATLNQVKKLINDIPNHKKLFYIIDKNTIEDIGADPHAVLALSARKGFYFSGSLKGSVFRPTHGSGHGYFPNFKEIQTGFVAFGAGIKEGKFIDEMSVMDIAPMIAHLLGIDFPSADGMLIRGMVK